MSTLTTINSGDLITNSRADINNNFTALNNDKIETSAIDTDTTLAANSDTKVPSQKAIKAYVDAVAQASLTTEVTVGTSHSLTTTANQRVLVFAKGTTDQDGLGGTIELNYNGVQKDIVSVVGVSSAYVPFSLMYTETPGAGTYNVTVTHTDNGGTVTLSDVVIIVMKFNV